MEQEGSWGLLLLDEPLGDETHGNIHWVGDRLPEEVHPVFSAKEEGNTWCTTHGDSEVYWTYLDGEWWTEDPEGAWWNWSDAKPWFDVNEAMAVDPAAGKEMQEALTLFQDKVRTFKESRQLVAARNTARGFYPLGGKSKGKGKGKGKSSFSPKGKGKAKKGGSTTASSPSSALAAEGSQRPGSSTYTGCFICGAKDHDFRRCPKRGSGKGSGAAHLLTDGHWTEAAGAYMVQAAPDETSHEPEDAVEQPELTEEPLCFMHVIAGNPSDDAAFGNFQIEAAMAVQGQLHPGFAVIDSGATETVGSLEAIEAVVSMRRTRYGLEDVRVFPEAKKSFRFGNAQQETATSYVEVPQTLGGRAVSLGVFALDVPRIPILLSIRTLKKLGAEINFQRKTIVFKAVDPGVVIGLQESASGHLLLDLVHDWLRTPSSSQGFSGTVLSQVLSGYKESAVHACEPEVQPDNNQEQVPQPPLPQQPRAQQDHNREHVPQPHVPQQPRAQPDHNQEHVPQLSLPQQPQEPKLPEQQEGHEHVSSVSAVQVHDSSRGHVECDSVEHVPCEPVSLQVPDHVPIFDMTAADKISRDSMGTFWSHVSPRRHPLREHGEQEAGDLKRQQRPSDRTEECCQGPAQGKEREGEDRVRPVKSHRARSARPADSRSAVPWQPHSDGGWPGQLVGRERPWAMGGLQGLQASSPLRSGLWRSCSLPPGWASSRGHQEGPGDRGGASGSRGTGTQGDPQCEGGCAPGRGGLSSASAGDGPLPEGQGHKQSRWQGQWQRLPGERPRREPQAQGQKATWSTAENEARAGPDSEFLRVGKLWHGRCGGPQAHSKEGHQESQCQGCRAAGGPGEGRVEPPQPGA